MRVELLIIDPQVDFCDPRNGTLYRGRSRAHAQVGDTKKADADRKKAIRFGVSFGKEPREKPPAGQGATLADIIAFALPLGVEVKQELLQELNVEVRVARLLQYVGKQGERTFPPEFSMN